MEAALLHVSEWGPTSTAGHIPQALPTDTISRTWSCNGKAQNSPDPGIKQSKCAMSPKYRSENQELLSEAISQLPYRRLGMDQNHDRNNNNNNNKRQRFKSDKSDINSIITSLKICAKQKSLEKGCRIHASVVKKGFLIEKNAFIGNALLNMYTKCGALSKAQEVFDILHTRDVISWTALIDGYVEYGNGKEALNCFEMMQLEGVSPDAITFICALKACGRIGASHEGQEIHSEIMKQGLLKRNIIVGNALVDMYAKCGNVAKAQLVFDELPNKDVVSWNSLMKGYAQYGNGEEAVKCFEQMQRNGVTPTLVTFICVLNACSQIGAADKGQEIHAQISRRGLIGSNLLVGNALVDMYAKCGLLGKAQQVFDELLFRDVISWTSLLSGYGQHGNGKEVMRCFEQMKCEGVCPNMVTYNFILQACGTLGVSEKGQKIHAMIINEVLLKKSILIGSALVDMYAKCGTLAKAQEVFDELPVRDVVLWTVLIAGYAEKGHGEKALECFNRMKADGILPSPVTFVCVLKACGAIGAATKGQEIHAEIMREGLVENDILIGNALVDMYAKCGVITKAQELFDNLVEKNVVSWTALMAGYAQVGKHDAVFSVLDKMIDEGISPDQATFSVVLNTCCHSGLEDKGRTYFESMMKVYGIIPKLEHYTCMVDLFGRAGHFDKVVEMIKEMPCSGDVTLWRSLLNACREWGNVNLGKLAFEHAIQFDSEDAAAYVSMYNIYAAAGLQEDANKVEALRLRKES